MQILQNATTTASMERESKSQQQIITYVDKRQTNVNLNFTGKSGSIDAASLKISYNNANGQTHTRSSELINLRDVPKQVNFGVKVDGSSNEEVN